MADEHDLLDIDSHDEEHDCREFTEDDVMDCSESFLSIVGQINECPQFRYDVFGLCMVNTILDLGLDPMDVLHHIVELVDQVQEVQPSGEVIFQEDEKPAGD